MAVVSIKVDAGVNKDLLPSELQDGMVSDCLNFRFRNGFATKFEGVVLKDSGAPISDDGSAWLTAVPGYAVYGNSVSAYAISTAGGTHYNITRNVPSQTISAMSGIGSAPITSANVTTSSPHNLTTGDKITVVGCTPAEYNTTNATVTVTSATAFTYSGVNSASTATVSTKGSYYVISSANSTNFTSTTTHTAGALNGIFFKLWADGLFYWGEVPSSKLRQAAFTVPAAAIVSRAFKNYVVLLGNDQTVYWSDAAQPGSFATTFAASATNDAGQSPALADTPGSLVDCLPLSNANIVYKKDSRWLMQYIGGNDVFRFERLPGEDGLFYANCVVNTPKGHVFLTQHLDVKIHQGADAVSIANGRVRNWLASQMSATTTRAILTVNPEKSEVWVCFPNASSTRAANRALVWNWETDNWGIFDLGTPVGTTTDGVCAAAYGTWPSTLSTASRLMLLDSTLHFKLVDSSATSGLTGTLERTGLDFGDRDSVKYIDRSQLNVNATAGGTCTIQHGGAMTAAASPTYAGPSTYTIGANTWLGLRGVAGKFSAVSLSTTVDSFSLRDIDLDVIKLGRR